jgi:hypothetical protein
MRGVPVTALPGVVSTEATMENQLVQVAGTSGSLAPHPV